MGTQVRKSLFLLCGWRNNCTYRPKGWSGVRNGFYHLDLLPHVFLQDKVCLCWLYPGQVNFTIMFRISLWKLHMKVSEGCKELFWNRKVSTSCNSIMYLGLFLLWLSSDVSKACICHNSVSSRNGYSVSFWADVFGHRGSPIKSLFRVFIQNKTNWSR